MRLLARQTLATALLLAALSSAAQAVEIARLGDFEDQSFGPWAVSQLSAGGNAEWFISDDGTYSPISNAPTFSPGGNWQAVSDCDGPYGTGILYRTVTIPTNAETLKLRFWYRSSMVGDMPDLNPGGQGQGVRVDVMTTAAPVTGMSGILSTLFATSYPANAADDVTPSTLTLGVQSLRGQTVRLRIASMANTAPMIVGVDDVRLEGEQYEEVAGTGLPNLGDGAVDWGDFDNDGDLDLAIEGTDGTTRHAAIYRNDGGTFTLFASAPDGFDNGDAKWLDTDGDGDLDVFFNGNRASGAWTWVGRNTGAGFTWATVATNVSQCKLAMGDYDADGDLDLIGSGYHVVNLYRNNGAGGFAEVTSTNLHTVDSAFVFLDTRDVYPGFNVHGLPLSGNQGCSVFTNDGQGASYTKIGSLAGLVAGCYAETGTALGQESYTFFAGRPPNSLALTGMVTNTFTGALITEDVTGLYTASAAWGDDNLDGLPDLFVVGDASGTHYAHIHRTVGTELQVSGDNFMSWTRAVCALGDYDSDGDLDILIMGLSGTTPTTRLFRNALTTTNAAPPAPTTPPSHTVLPAGSGLVLFSTSAWADDHTPSNWRTLNFRAGTTPGGTDVISPDSDPVTGTRLVARPGNSRGAASYTLSAAVLHARRTPIYFAVQGVDQQFKGSAWSPETRLVLGPTFTAVTDVPADQGGAVRLTLSPSPLDAAGAELPATAYNVFGRVSSPALAEQVTRAAATQAAGPVEDGALATVAVGDRRFVAPAAALAAGFPAGTWEILASFAAYQAPQYIVRVNTVADSGASGPNWSVFLASVHTADAGDWWLSPPDSGKSLDNIAPGAPQGVQLSYHPGTHNALSWQPSAAEDFQYFRVYRGATPGFTISPGTLVASTADIAWTDPAPGSTGVYYKVTALDHAGNESAAASPSVTTDVEGGAPAPEFALGSPSPSPFALSTRIGFTLPKAARTTLEVFDAGGRRVRTLADGVMAAGAHEIAWDGTGERGTRVPAGLLFIRLRADGREAVRRLVVLGGTR